MQQININELKPHPRNNEFFDDISGENWDAFIESVKSSGIIEPIVVTGDKYIVSGHQRVRACKELGIESILTKCKPYFLNDNYDAVLKDLIETNIRQRGIGNTNQKKMGLCIKELDRIYGIREGSQNKKGNNRIGQTNNFTDQNLKTEEELLKSLGLGVTRQTIQNYKKLTEMIPELEELIDVGIVTYTTALAIMKNLSIKEQEDLIASLDTTKKITQKEVQKYIDEIRELKNTPPETIDNTDYSRIQKLENEISKLKTENKKLEPITPPDDSNTDLINKINNLQKEKENLELLNKTLKSSKESTEKLMELYKTESEEYTKMKNDIAKLGLQPDGDYNILDLSNNITTLTDEIEELLTTKLSPMRYAKTLPVIKSNNALKRNMENLIYMVNNWCQSMADTLGLTENENIIDMEEMN